MHLNSEIENISNKSEKYDHHTFNSSQKMSDGGNTLAISTFNFDGFRNVK